MQKIIKNNWQILSLVLLSIFIVWPLFLPGYFSHHDDVQVMRVFEMQKCIRDLQLPCRWVQDMGYGYGFPVFNYYPVLPYYIAGVASFLLGFIGAVKLIFFIPLVLGGISMYFLAKEFFNKNAAFVAGVLYLFAPYRALDSYTRGAIAESFAIALIPLVFYSLYKLIQNFSLKNFILATLFLAAFLLSHNITVLLFSQFILVWIIYWLYFQKFKNWSKVLLVVVLGVGLAAFFLFPAFLEKNLVQTDSLIQGDLNFREHFVALPQLFLDHSWGYGASVYGNSDSISFQIGWPHWWLLVVLLCLVIKSKFKISREILFVSGFFVIMFGFSIFMTHNQSAFVWERIPILAYTQFPWRFLSLTILAVSILGGATVQLVNLRFQKVLIFLIVVLTIFLNWSFFKPDKFFYDLTDDKKLSGVFYEAQQKAAIMDYLPMGAQVPKEAAPLNVQILSGQARVGSLDKRTNTFDFNIDTTTDTKVQIPVFDFPNWQIFANKNLIIHSHDKVLDRIEINLPPGNYHISGMFKDTVVRTVSNIISLVSLLVFSFFIFYDRKKLK